MKILKNLIQSVNIPRIIGAFQKSDSKAKTAQLGKMGGGGLLLIEGAYLIIEGSGEENIYKIVGGCLLLIVGVIVAERLGKQITQIDEASKTD